jgi:hypothetical protein
LKKIFKKVDHQIKSGTHQISFVPFVIFSFNVKSIFEMLGKKKLNKKNITKEDAKRK